MEEPSSISNQDQIIRTKEQECVTRSQEELPPKDGQVYCPTMWDGAFCWPFAPAGSLLSAPCPSYIMGFDQQRVASKMCGDGGEWFVHEGYNTTWTNYSMCSEGDHVTRVVGFNHLQNVTLLKSWIPVLKTISRSGYTVSLVTLTVAFFILAFIKKLRCPRNMLHMHLFVSFIMRAFMALLKDSLFIEGVGLSPDVVLEDGELAFVSENETWECRAITSLWQYFIMANYAWILMEGLYLHNLIFLAPFSDSSAITLYVGLGWGLPAISVVPWVILRATLDNTFCWTTNHNQVLFLIIRVPVIVSIILNFALFINIVRVLLLKLRSSVSVETRKYRYRKWAKSTLVLVPLFGVHYMLFLGMSYSMGIDETVELVWLFCDQLFASFQGFFVAVLYCLLNGEVRAELSKRCGRWRSFLWLHGASSCNCCQSGSSKDLLGCLRSASGPASSGSSGMGGTESRRSHNNRPNGSASPGGERRVKFSGEESEARFAYQMLSSPQSSCLFGSATDTTQWSECTKSTDVSPHSEGQVWTIYNNSESAATGQRLQHTSMELEGLKEGDETV